MSNQWPFDNGGNMSPEEEWFRNLQPSERLRMDMLIDQYRPKQQGLFPSVTNDLVWRGGASPIVPLGPAPLDAPDHIELLAAQSPNPQSASMQQDKTPWYNQPGQLDRFENDPNSRHVTQIPSEEQQPNPKIPIGITTRNDRASDPDTDRAIDQRLADALEAAAEDVVGFNINSSTGGLHGTGKPGSSSHYHGRAVDINNVGGLAITDPKVQQAADALVKHLRGNPKWIVFLVRIITVSEG